MWALGHQHYAVEAKRFRFAQKVRQGQTRLTRPDAGVTDRVQSGAEGHDGWLLSTLECGGSTPLSFFSFAYGGVQRRKKERKKESGVKPPHSKDHIFAMTALANSPHLTSLAPSISRAKS